MPPSAQQEQPHYMHDPVTFTRNMAEISEKMALLLQGFFTRQVQDPEFAVDPFNVAGAFTEMYSRLAADPASLVGRQMALWKDYMQLWQNTAQRLFGEETQPLVPADHKDRRFKDAAWQENVVYDHIRQSYLLTAQ